MLGSLRLRGFTVIFQTTEIKFQWYWNNNSQSIRDNCHYGCVTARVRQGSSKLAIFWYAQARKIPLLQNQIGLLNRLVILNKLRILPRRLNEKLCLNSACFWLAGLADLVTKSVANTVHSDKTSTLISKSSSVFLVWTRARFFEISDSGRIFLSRSISKPGSISTPGSILLSDSVLFFF